MDSAIPGNYHTRLLSAGLELSCLRLLSMCLGKTAKPKYPSRILADFLLFLFDDFDLQHPGGILQGTEIDDIPVSQLLESLLGDLRPPSGSAVQINSL